MCESLCVCHECVGAQGGQKRGLHSLELESHGVMSLLTQVLGTELKFSQRVAGALDQ